MRTDKRTKPPEKSYDKLTVDPWLATVNSKKPPPCDCPCHRWPRVQHAPCCPNTGRRWVRDDLYAPYESEDE